MASSSVPITPSKMETTALQTTPTKMIRYEGVLLCLMVMVMDLIAGILGIEAEIAQSKMKHVTVLIFECKEPSHQAFSLGLGAMALLVLAHVIATWLGGWMCICSVEELKRSSTKKKLAAAAHVLSWSVGAVALLMLLIGAISNTASNRPCALSRRNFLSVGGILCFFHGLVCVAYYISATVAAAEEEKLRVSKPGKMQTSGQSIDPETTTKTPKA